MADNRDDTRPGVVPGSRLLICALHIRGHGRIDIENVGAPDRPIAIGEKGSIVSTLPRTRPIAVLTPEERAVAAVERRGAQMRLGAVTAATSHTNDDNER